MKKKTLLFCIFKVRGINMGLKLQVKFNIFLWNKEMIEQTPYHLKITTYN